MAEVSDHLLRKSFDRRTRREPISCYLHADSESHTPRFGASASLRALNHRGRAWERHFRETILAEKYQPSGWRAFGSFFVPALAVTTMYLRRLEGQEDFGWSKVAEAPSGHRSHLWKRSSPTWRISGRVAGSLGRFTRRAPHLLGGLVQCCHRFHDLRHCCATLLLVQGVPARVVQEILGHSHVSTTLGIYSHMIPLLKRDAAERMNALLGPAETAVNTPTGTSSGAEG